MSLTVDGAMQEMVGSFDREQAEKDLRKSICERVKEELKTEINVKDFKKMSKFKFKANLAATKNELQHLEEEFERHKIKI